MERINVGLIGFGTVGSGVVKVLQERNSLLREKVGIDIRLVKIYDKDVSTKRDVRINKRKILTRSLGDVLYNQEIDIVVELIGGITPAKDIILEAIRQGKHVVTANKALLAQAGRMIFELARQCGVCVEFEGSVGGGIPIIRALKEGLISNRIELIYGIVNGTSNFVLSKMAEEKISFQEALKSAKRLGYAEKNPALDIGGIDSAHKLAILSLLGFGFSTKPDTIYTEGIERIEESDIRYSGELGYALKLLAIAKADGDQIELRVHPTLIPESHLLAGVGGVFNAIYVKGDLIGESLYYGEGAGRFPTASSVVADIVSIAQKRSSGICAERSFAFSSSIKRLKAIGDISARHYIRFSAIDKPGVLAKIAGILGRHRISIASVTQKQQRRAKVVPIVMMTHKADESDVAAALAAIDKLNIIRGRSIRIRVEG